MNYSIEDKLVSIIVPVYNVEQYLETCIESILNQTYRNIEVVLVDDGSTDSSGRICDEFALIDHRVKVIHKPNGGLSSARKAGIDVVNGSYAMFVDSDDWIELTMIEKMLGIAEQYNCDCVCCGYTRERGDASSEVHLYSGNQGIGDCDFTEKFYRRLFGLNGEELKFPEKSDSTVSACMKLYSSVLLKKADYIDEKIVGSGEDVLLNISALRKCKHLCYIDECLYHYRRDVTTSLTSKPGKNLEQQWEKLFSYIESYINEYHLPNSYQEALNNRISLGMIGLGLYVISDPTFSFWKKKDRLSRILRKELYANANWQLDTTCLPLKWKIFFCMCKYKQAFVLSYMLLLMDFLRKRKIKFLK